MSDDQTKSYNVRLDNPGQRIEQHLAVGDAPAFSVVAYRGIIRLHTGSPGEVQLIATARGNDAFGLPDGRWLTAIKIGATKDGASLRVLPEASGYGPGGNLVRALDIDIWAPNACAVTVQTPNGLVLLEDFAGAAFIRTQSGPVSLRRVSGCIYVIGHSGSCTAQWIRGDIAVALAGGSLQIRESSLDNLMATTGAGDIEVQSRLSASGIYSMRSESGNIRAQLPPEAEAQFDLSTQTGHLDYRLPAGLEEINPGYWTAYTTMGVVAQVRLSSRDGNLTLLPWEPEGDLPAPPMPSPPANTRPPVAPDLRLLFTAWREHGAAEGILTALAALPPAW